MPSGLYGAGFLAVGLAFACFLRLENGRLERSVEALQVDIGERKAAAALDPEALKQMAACRFGASVKADDVRARVMEVSQNVPDVDQVSCDVSGQVYHLKFRSQSEISIYILHNRFLGVLPGVVVPELFEARRIVGEGGARVEGQIRLRVVTGG